MCLRYVRAAMSRAQVESAILHAAAEFVNRESNRQSLITVTKVELDERGLKGRVYVSVFPDERAATALEFLERRADDFRDFVKKRIKLRGFPTFAFVQDPNIGGLDVEESKRVA